MRSLTANRSTNFYINNIYKETKDCRKSINAKDLLHDYGGKAK